MYFSGERKREGAGRILDGDESECALLRRVDQFLLDVTVGTQRRVRSTPSGRTGRSVLRVCHFVAYGLEFRTSCPRTRIVVPAAVHEDCCVRKADRPYRTFRFTE